MIVEFAAELWLWDARQGESWTFVSLPAEASEDIRELTDGQRRGFGAVKVQVRIGLSNWSTSIFPDSKRQCYVLPIKKAVRKAQSLEPGDMTTVTLELI